MKLEFSKIEVVELKDLSEEDREDILQAREEYARGETIAFEDIDWD